MDLIDLFLGRGKRFERADGLLGWLSRRMISCGCLLAALVLLGAVLVITGFVQVSDNALTVVIVFITIIVAVASLIRTSLGY
jgi:hypothetical protein